VIDPDRVCALCGEPPGHLYGTFFGANVDGLDLHHDFDRIIVGYRTDRTPIKVTCYHAWTVWGIRPRDHVELDCGA
jgi:hypothetical protein